MIGTLQPDDVSNGGAKTLTVEAVRRIATDPYLLALKRARDEQRARYPVESAAFTAAGEPRTGPAAERWDKYRVYGLGGAAADVSAHLFWLVEAHNACDHCNPHEGCGCEGCNVTYIDGPTTSRRPSVTRLGGMGSQEINRLRDAARSE